MPTIRVGVQANSTSSGQNVDIDAGRANVSLLSNASAEGVQYSTNSGESWATVAAGASAVVGDVTASGFRVRRQNAGGYPLAIDVTFSPADVPITGTPSDQAAFQALVSGAWNGKGTAIAFGNSLCRQNQIAANGAANQVAYNSHLWLARAMAGDAFEWVQTGPAQQIGGSASSWLVQGIYGYSGGTSTQMLPFFDSVVTANKPDICILQVMENDILYIPGTMTLDEAKGNYLAMIQGCVNAGIRPVWIECLPSKSFTTAAHSAAYCALNAYVQSLQSVFKTLVYVPTADLYTNSALTTPQPLSAGIYANYVDASVHVYAAAPLVGARIADVLIARGIVGSGFIPGPGDARFVGGNSFTSGTGGTASAPVTGQVINGLTVSSSTTTQTIAASVIDRAGRQCQKIDMTAGTSTGIQAAWTLFGGAGGYTTGFSVGDLVQLFVEIELDALTTQVGLRDLSAYLSFVGGSNDAYTLKKATGDLFDTNTFPTGRKLLLVTPLTAVPAGTTGLRPFAQCFASNNAASIVSKAYITKFAVINWSRSN